MEENKNNKRKLIRNSTAEFLMFQLDNKEQGIEVYYKDETLWMTQKAMSALFDCSTDNIGLHLKNIYSDGELSKEATTEEFSVVRKEGDRNVTRNLLFYNLDAVISTGYRVSTTRATQFRQWATAVLRQFAIRGYVIDRKRMENGTYLNEDYFEHLLAEIREIRLSERRFYQKITDIYATSVDYNKDAPTTKDFFAKVQNKMHYAIHGQDMKHTRLNSTLSLLTYKITDVIGGFIMHYYINHSTKPDSRIHYEDCHSFNEFFDEDYPLEIGGVILSASEVLYSQDYEAYKENYYSYLDNLNKEG